MITSRDYFQPVHESAGSAWQFTPYYSLFYILYNDVIPTPLNIMNMYSAERAPSLDFIVCRLGKNKSRPGQVMAV